MVINFLYSITVNQVSSNISCFMTSSGFSQSLTLPIIIVLKSSLICSWIKIFQSAS